MQPAGFPNKGIGAQYLIFEYGLSREINEILILLLCNSHHSATISLAEGALKASTENFLTNNPGQRIIVV